MGQISSRLGLTSEKSKNEKFENSDNYNKSNGFYYIYKSDIDAPAAQSSLNSKISTPLSSFVTPRLPLKRTHQDLQSPISLPQSFLDIFSPSKRAKMEEEYLDFSFLIDKDTVEYLKKCKVIFITRGLPGSGKSTIVDALKRKYPLCESCSADDYFMVNGEYMYDFSKISEAHKACKENCVNTAVAQTKTIIIDNTNIRLWEFKFYLKLAEAFNYFPIVVEPKTPWRRDAEILANKNTHNVDKTTISKKINSFQELKPLFYGWFLNEMDSYLLSVEGNSWIEEAFAYEAFKKDMEAYSNTPNLEEFLKAYIRPGNSELYHCTSKYTARMHSDETAAAYVSNDFINDAVGKMYELHIIGFVITPRTFGARIKLMPAQLPLWGGEDYEEIPHYFMDLCPEESNLLAESDKSGDNLTLEVSNLSGESNDHCDLNSFLNYGGGINIQIDTNQQGNENSFETNCNDAVINNSNNDNIDYGGINNLHDNIMTTNSNHSNVENNNEVEINNLSGMNSSLGSNQEVNNLSGMNSSLGYNQEDYSGSRIKNNTVESSILETNNEEIGKENVLLNGAQDSYCGDAKYESGEGVSEYNAKIKLNSEEDITPKKYSKKKIYAKKTIVVNKISPLTPPRPPSNTASSPNKRSPSKSPNDKDNIIIPENLVKPQNSRTVATIKETQTDDHIKNKYFPTCGNGQRAHITLGCKEGVKPVTTGLDLLLAIDLEEKAAEDSEREMTLLKESMKEMGVEDQEENLEDSSTEPLRKTLQHTLLLNGATIRNYGNGVWVVYLDEKLVVSSLFNVKC